MFYIQFQYYYDIVNGIIFLLAMIKYLSEESNEATKIGAIGLGAVTGYILALRGGFFRKLLFSGAGAYAMSALAYPKPTYNCTQSALMESKRFVKIGINFVYGGMFLVLQRLFFPV